MLNRKESFELIELEAGLSETASGELDNWKYRVTVEFQNLHFTVTTREGTSKDILENISGKCSAGRLLSILGPSGAGKTTLLDVLAGNIYTGSVTGSVTVNNVPVPPKQLQYLSCYVMQNPILLSAATVKESLMTSALLRLPKSVPYSHKLRLVEDIMEELGLTECANILIGNEVEGIKGISGGQKRRLAVGIELVTKPSVILLDEPTSGLDSEIALTIMKTLKVLSAKGRTVVCTIHQPNSDIVDTFDDFMLLANGRTLYYGRWDSAVEFFSSAGHKCPVYKNPTDYFMSVVKVKEVALAIADNFAVIEKDALSESNGKNGGPTEDGKKKISVLMSKKTGSVPFWYQTYVLWMRFLRTWQRHPMLFGAEFTQYAFIAVFIGLMYLQLGNSIGKGAFDRYASQFFCLVAVIFTPAFSAATLWDSERLLIRVESARNAYSLGAYFTAKTLTTWPMEIVFTLIFSVITYYMIGFQNDAGKFLSYWAVLILFQLISECIGLLCAVSTKKSAYAVLLLSLLFLPILSFTGFIVRDIPVYFKWIQKIAYINFATSTLASLEFKGLTFKGTNGEDILGDRLFEDEVITEDPVAEDVRQTMHILDNGLSVGWNLVIMTLMLVVLRVMTYASLKLSAKMRWL